METENLGMHYYYYICMEFVALDVPVPYIAEHKTHWYCNTQSEQGLVLPYHTT